jgi:hypothetical protein
MGQQDICNFLKAHRDDWYSSEDISNGLNISIGSVTVCLKKLRENNEVQFKYTDNKHRNRKQYMYKYLK